MVQDWIRIGGQDVANLPSGMAMWLLKAQKPWMSCNGNMVTEHFLQINALSAESGSWELYVNALAISLFLDPKSRDTQLGTRPSPMNQWMALPIDHERLLLGLTLADMPQDIYARLIEHLISESELQQPMLLDRLMRILEDSDCPPALRVKLLDRLLEPFGYDHINPFLEVRNQGWPTFLKERVVAAKP